MSTRDPLSRIVVVGAGLGGLRTAEALRRLGFGGTLTLVGEESHLPYDRPPLSKQVLRGEAEVVLLRQPDAYAELGLDLRLGVAATALDVDGQQVVLSDGSQVAYDGLVLAPGATPRLLPGSEHVPGVHALRTVDDCAVLAADLKRAGHLVVVGAGFIGCEVAASARKMGVACTLVELLPAPLVRVLGAEVAAEVARVHAAAGVELRMGVGVSSIEGDAAVERVLLSDGTVLAADAVVVGLGVRPATDWLHGSGVEVGDGIVCDEFCQTTVPGVYAVGDAASWAHQGAGRQVRVEHWTNATEQAEAVAHNLLAPPDERLPFAPVPYFWSDQYDVKIQSLGFPSGDDDVEVHRVGPHQRLLALYARDGRLSGVVGFSAARFVMQYGDPLRAGISLDAARALVAPPG